MCTSAISGPASAARAAPSRAPGPLAATDLAVVPIDPREVLWAVEKMIKL